MHIYFSYRYKSKSGSGKNPREKVIQVTTSVTENPPTISFKWNPIPGHFNIEIFRKDKNASEWGNAIAILPASTVEYTDNNVEPDIIYEYAIKAKWWMRIETYVTAGIKYSETEYRGKIILLVDSTFVPELKMELERYESDLIGDGWQVLRKDISRTASVKYVKSVIHDFYNSDPENVNSVFLFGHIPVPYSGDIAYDGHDDNEHEGAWPADMYYGSLNEKIWRDKSICCTTAVRLENRNIPGDGKFDLCKLPSQETISLSIGRVDFSNLPAFPESEEELLRNYLNKNHAFRHKIINPKLQAMVDDHWGIIRYTSTEAFAISGWRNFSALLNFQNVKADSFFYDTENDSYIWSYACGGGNYDLCKHVGNTNDFVSHKPKTVFTAFYGSWFGDWDTENNFMRAALASKGWILTSCWAGRPHYTFHQMGMGETIGNCVRATQNNLYLYFSGASKTAGGIHQSLMGDPSLRMHIVEPPNSLKSAIRGSQSVTLSWNAPTENILGYYIYKLDTLTNLFERITDTPVTTTFFKDVFPDKGNNYYMVRALKLSEVASGSYYNLSQGIFDTIYYEPTLYKSNLLTDITDYGNEIKIYPNPTSGKLRIDFGTLSLRQAKFVIYDVHGRQIYLKQFENCNNAEIDLSNEAKGVYIIKGNIDRRPVTAKILLR